MAGNILIVAEHESGEVESTTYELIARGRELKEKLNARLDILVLGSALDALVDMLASKGADAVLAVDDPRLEPYLPEVYAKAISQVISEVKPQVVLFGHTYRGIELAPAVATRLDSAFIGNCLDLEVKDGALFAVRPVFQGTLRSRVKFEGGSPWIASMQKTGLPVQASQGTKAEVRRLKVEISDKDIQSKVVGLLKPAEAIIDIAKADKIVSVGRGIKSKDNVKLAEELAKALGGVIACSRPVADMGWLPPECHVGISGKTVNPKVYIACGISGASQHIAGIRGSQIIIAINSDANAPIFRVAHYGVVADLFELIPALTQEAKQ